MDEYIERKRAIVDACNALELYPSEYAQLEDALNRTQAADVAKVVRCQDCVHHHDCGTHFCDKLGMDCPDDSEFFCKYGEPKAC